VKANFAPGLHVPSGQAANVSAYDRWVGRWSRLFVPAVISAAEVMPGSRVLDVSTGTGEAALMALPAVGPSGVVIGADIAPAMLAGARDRLKRDFGIDPLLRGDVLGRNGRVGWKAATPMWCENQRFRNGGVRHRCRRVASRGSPSHFPG
jgi:SAM-dependent methyltransferase